VHVAYGGIMAEIVTRAVREVPVVVSFCGSDLLGSPAEPFPRRLECRLGVVASHIAARRAAAIVVKSRNLRDALPRDAARGNVWILPSGIDMRLFAPLDRAACRARLGWAANRRHVLFPAAANRPEKRYGLAEETVAALRARGHDVDLHELRGVAHADVPAWMNAADVVLITSTHEGSPNAVKEALACEVPIVSVDVGDVADRLASIDGAYVAAANADALASAVERVLSGPGRVDARATLEDISLERIAAKQREIYEIAVAGETRAKAA
jgi:glycosyltransferase involved in cell wall biosynthesis